jgi:hypothetical protein
VFVFVDSDSIRGLEELLRKLKHTCMTRKRMAMIASTAKMAILAPTAPSISELSCTLSRMDW